MEREYRLFVHLPGETLYHLCTVSLPEQAAEVARVLIGADKPEFLKVTIEIGADLGDVPDGRRR